MENKITGFIRINKGHYQVARFCCTSGMCIYCRAYANGTKRKRIVHIDNIDKTSAELIAANWSSYGAVAEQMPITSQQVAS